ncbi:MAG: hypothetical protein ABEJ30_09170 [Halorientalis sp.]
MSPSSPSNSEPSTPLASDTLPSLARYGAGLRSGVTTVAFWAAVVLPFLHLPLLATGLDSLSVTLAFVALLALNVVAVVLGHTSYRRD